MIEKLNDGLPTMLSYKTHIDKDSAFNTPPVFAIYVVDKVLHWIEKMGGLAKIAEYNREKASYIYDILDNSSFYRGTVVKEDRSYMNIPLRLPNEELEAKFVKEAKERGMIGLKGHRSVGGIRVSLYNAVPIEGAEKLAEFMKEFAEKNAKEMEEGK
jgi:phosphoserine aminotransferase